jgi:hypothetical protein
VNHRGSSASVKLWRHRHTVAHLSTNSEQTLRRHHAGRVADCWHPRSRTRDREDRIAINNIRKAPCLSFAIFSADPHRFEDLLPNTPVSLSSLTLPSLSSLTL